MPYVRRYFSQQECDSSLEPSVKKSKLDYTELCKKKTSEEFIPLDSVPQRWGSSGLSETRYYGSDEGERKNPRVTQHFQSDSDRLRPGSYKRYSSESPSSRREDDKKKQQELPKTDNWKANNSDAAFSETSTSFIGPLYQPPPHSRTNHNDSSKPPSFRITTVESGKVANKTKREVGIDYELHQFYKELHELEEITDNHNDGQTGADSEQHPIHHSHPNNAPTIQQVTNHHCQTPSSQPCNPFSNKPSALIPPSSHPTEDHRFPAEHRALPPINKPDSCDRPPPLDRINSSFVNQSFPPPGFQGPLAPSFPVHHGHPPPPPRYNYPMTLPRQNNTQNSPYHGSENYQRVNDNYLRPPTQFSCSNSYLPPENRFSSQDRCYTEPFPKPPVVYSEQTYEREDSNGQHNRHFGHITPTGGNVHHEPYPPRFRDNPNQCITFKRKLVLLRGVPGSGKSTLARFLLDRTPDGIVFSTDDYFCQDNGYAYDVKLLGDAHSWNQDRARRAMDDGRSPIIIDNTNIQGWEMKPYVQMAIDRGYDVEFLEPNTWWKLDALELEKRNTHRVPREKISQMLERFEHDMNVAVVMNSVEPRRGRPPPEDRQRWGASVDDYTQRSKSFQIR